MDCSLPGSSSHGIFQARVLEWGAIAFSDSVLYSDVNGKEIQKKRGYTYILIHFVIQQKLKWASLVAQTVTNPPTKQETWVRALDREESDTTERLHFHFSLSCIGEGNGNPLQCSCLENPRDRGAWWAAVYGVAQSRTQLKQLSSSSSSSSSSQV